MAPVQAKSTPVQVKEPYGNLDMVTCRLSSCNPECTKYTCREYSKEGLAVYRERKIKKEAILMSVKSELIITYACPRLAIYAALCSLVDWLPDG